MIPFSNDRVVLARRLLEALPDAVFVVGEDGRIGLSNDRAAELVGYQEEGLEGMTPEELMPPRYRAAHPDKMRAFFSAPYARPMAAGLDLFVLHKSGFEIPVDISLGWFEDDGRRWALATMRDLRGALDHEARLKASQERVQKTEQLLIQAAKMESLGRLAGGVAHDFNNLLTAIGGYASMAEAALGNQDPAHADLREIQKAVSLASELTRQLTAFSRRKEFTPGPVGLNALVGGVQRMLARVIGEQISLELALADGLPEVLADPSQLEQVLLNLAVNARDAMPDGGRLYVETRRTREEGADWVELAVTDSGMGIPADRLERIFEPFFTTKAEGHGTGLGLATVQDVVQRCGGRVKVSSEPGKGSTFTIQLRPAA